MTGKAEPLGPALGLLFTSHPWHGVPIGDAAPERVTVYVEIVPTDTVKYELDKNTGLLTVDRPQKYSNVSPSLYGFVPRTLCAEAVAAYCAERTGRTALVGDMDPLDICVSPRSTSPTATSWCRRSRWAVCACWTGTRWTTSWWPSCTTTRSTAASARSRELPPLLLDRLRHYFLTYKQGPDEAHPSCEITHVYGRAEAHVVIARSQLDYEARYSGLVAARATIEKG